MQQDDYTLKALAQFLKVATLKFNPELFRQSEHSIFSEVVERRNQ